MANIDDVYTGDWMKAADLKEDKILEIESTKAEKMEDESQKLVVSFKNFKQSLVCNKTNAKKIAELVGDKDYSKWAGIKIKLVKRKTEYMGEEVDAIRVESAEIPTEKPVGV